MVKEGDRTNVHRWDLKDFSKGFGKTLHIM